MNKKPAEPVHSSKSSSSPTNKFRLRAINDRRATNNANMSTASSEQMVQLIHELRVHQIELAIQNEELHTAQIALQRSQAQYFELYELAPVGYLTLNEKGLIIALNLTASELLGVKKNVIDKQPLSQFLMPGHQDTYYLFFQQLLADLNKHTCEVCMLKPNGNIFWATLEAHAIKDQASGALLVRCVLSDFTKRQQAEQKERELRKQNEQLLKLQVVNQTIAAIAHDLNQPLCAATSYINAAQNLLRKENNVPAKATYALDQTTQQIQRASQVIQNLLSCLHSGETVVEPIDLNQMVHTIVNKLKQDTSVHSFQVVLKLTQGLPKVASNALQLEMILANLLRNAIEAMEGSKLTSGTIQVVVHTADSGDCAHLSVKDNGPGVPEEKINSIFEPFFSTKPHGLGIGLAISRALIEAQGGQLWCESNTDSPGATFYLTIPFAT